MFLFICMTNLQLLIARSIIEKERLKKVDVLFIGDVDNVKNQYYLKKIQPLCRHSEIVPQVEKFSTFKTIQRTRYAKKSWKSMPENIIPFSSRIFMSRLYTIFYLVSLFLK